ncbi:MAG: FAD:protein FMN transferase [Deltaproteobacteria bacterium]|nr:FAD:protein FMN transferase [Deltaproteobacteria bacterium]
MSSRRVAQRLAIVGLTAALGLACEREPAPSPAPRASTPKSSTPASPPPATKTPAAPKPKGPPIRKDGTVFADSELMGTRVSINVWAGPPAAADGVGAEKAIRAAFDEMARLEQILSEWRPNSELSRLSNAAGGPARPLSPELLDVLVRSRAIASATSGAFDPTFHGVGQLWSFAPGATPPTRAEVEAKLPLVDWHELELDETAGTGRLSKPGMKLGLGAIGKGFAADEASALLARMGFPNHVVEVGGDTYAAGTKDGKPWMVGIQRPGERGVVGALPSRNLAVVTSGDYQRYFEHEGTRYSHILDPQTGWPVPADRSPKSVTLVASNATDADAYCTAVAVMGVEAGMTFVETHEGLEAVIITQDDQVEVSTGLRAQLVRPPAAPNDKTPAPPQTGAAGGG